MEKVSARAADRFQQPVHGNFQRVRDFLQYYDRRIPNSAFDTTDVGPVDLALEGQAFLRKALFLAEFCDVEADPAPNIHGSKGARMATIDLQTISLIFVDFGSRPWPICFGWTKANGF